MLSKTYNSKIKVSWNSDFSYDLWAYTQYLDKRGVSSQDRILLSMENSYDFLIIFFSLVNKGCSIVLADASSDKHGINRIFNDSDSNYCISNKLMGSSNPTILHTNIEQLGRASPLEHQDLDIHFWKNKKDALILYTSGSTGKPKGVVKSGDSFIANIYETMRRMEYSATDVLLPLLPFTHFYGLSILFIWLFSKCKIVLCNYRHINTVFKSIFRYQVTVVDAIPSTYYLFNRLFSRRSKLLTKIKQSTIRLWCVGGSPLPLKVYNEFMFLTGKSLLDGYGLTEAGNIALNNVEGRYGCGQPLNNVSIKICDANGKELPRGQKGEIYVQSNGVMEEYYQLKEDTSSVFDNGWLKTKDIGYIDQNGNLCIIGRMGGEINRKGYVIHPSEIEKILADQYGMRCKVIAKKSEKKGALLYLIVETGNEKEIILRNQINKALNAILRPDKIVFLSQLPYLSNGKIDQVALKRLLKLKVKKQEGTCLGEKITYE